MDEVVETALGRIAGVRTGGLSRFHGVPYAADTGGANRFRPPRPVRPWPGVRSGAVPGPLAPQPQNSLIDTSRRMGEDCLTLDVWTPAADGARRPVVVWLHGGGYFAGSALAADTDGALLARAHDVVVVSVTHRLGLLGFLDLEHAGTEFAGSGNASMLDIVAALEWIRDNIATFGGDPRAVTVAGHSGGGGKVTMLLGMPAARGLFHRAVVMAGPPFDLNDVSRAECTSDELLGQLGLARGTAHRIRELPLPRLLDAQVAFGVGARPGPRSMRLAPVIGRPEVPVDPVEALLAGMSTDVGLMLGTALDEARFVLAADPGFLDRPMDDDELTSRVRPGLDDPSMTGELIARYRGLMPTASQAELCLAIASDQFRIRTLRLAQARLAGGGPAPFVYLCAAGSGGPAGACHGVEVPLFFGADDELAGALARFARTGAPGRTWPPYTTDDRRELVIGDGGAHAEPDPHGERRRAWSGIVTGRRTNPWEHIGI